MLVPESTLAQLIVRNLDDRIVRALKRRAAANGRSAEAEHRAILRAVLLGETSPGRSFKQTLAAMPDVGDDQDFARPTDRERDVDL